MNDKAMNDAMTADGLSTRGELAVGSIVFTRTHRLDRRSLVAYAAASGDHNPIHYNDAAAAAAGLPGVLAHGMLTMGLAATAVAEWAGSAAAVQDISTRFSRPVVVPGDGEAELTITGKVKTIEADTVRIDLQVTCGGKAVLAGARATIRRAGGA